MTKYDFCEQINKILNSTLALYRPNFAEAPAQQTLKSKDH